ncbi:MAG: PAS domain S-box protein [Alphaproteobacteria bacterium]
MRISVIFRLVVGFTTLLIFLMGMLTVSNIYVIQKTVIGEFHNSVNILAENMATRASILYKDNRIKDIEEEFESYIQYYPNIWFHVHFNDYPEMDVTYEQQTKLDPKAEPHIILNLEQWYNTSYPIILDDLDDGDDATNGEVIGTIEVALETSRIRSIIRTSIWQNIYLGGLEVLLGAMFSLFVGLWLVSRLGEFEKASKRIAQGDYGVSLRVDGNNEISQTAQAFNQMSQELQRNMSALKSARNQFRTIFESAHDGIMILDKDNIITASNRSGLNIFGFLDTQDIIGKKFLEVTHINKYNFTPEEIFNTDPQTASLSDPILATKTDGTQIYVKLSPSHIIFDNKNYISLVIRNVTQSYLSEKRVSASEARLRAIINTSLDGMVMLNSDGRIEDFSPAAERILGFTRDSVLQKSLAQLIIPENERKNFEHLLNFYRNENELPLIGSRNKIQVLKYGRSLFPSEITVTSLNQESEVIFVIFIRDITTQIKTESMLTNARNQAENANKAKTRFLAMISHEIRTPIAGVIGILDLLDETQLSSEQKELVAQAQSSSDSLLTILNDILDWSSVEQGKLKLVEQSFSLDDLLRSIYQLMSPLAHAKGLNLKLIKKGKTPEFALGDPGRIRQVILNLLSNAIKFTSQGNITLSVASFQVYHQEFSFEVSVKDQGPGISKEEQKLLFREFSQLDFAYKNQKGGTGLGLAISQRLVKLMGGKIQLKSEVNVGSEFTFQLPLKVTDGIKEEDIIEDISIRSYNHMHILLVEDIQTNQFIIRKQLEEAGYKVSSAWDGTEAVHLCKKQKFDAILMDIAMPNMDGVTATLQIRSQKDSLNIQTPVIGLSAHAYQKDKDKALSAGMSDFLTKPVRKPQLLKALSICWTENNPPMEQNDMNHDTSDINTLPPSLCIQIDENIYNQLLEDLGKDSFNFIIQNFPKDNEAFIKNLKEMQQGITNSELAIRSAHSLKGSSSSVGFLGLSEAAKKVEYLARDGDELNFTQNLEPLFVEWEKVVTFIKENHPSQS